MKLAKTIITELLQNNISIDYDGDDLLIDTHNREMPVDLLHRLKENKQNVLNYLRDLKRVSKSLYKAEKKGFYEASSQQRRLFLHQSLDHDSVAYNIPSVFEIQGELDTTKLVDSINAVIAKHESLRTYFTFENDRICQNIVDHFCLQVDYEEVNEDEIISKIKNFVKPFDLQKLPLIRSEIYCVDRARHFLLIDIHHIISDGVSMGLFFDDLSKMYNGEFLNEQVFQYKDVSEFRISENASDSSVLQKKFWAKELEGSIPVLELKTDFDRPAVKSFDGGNVKFELTEDVTAQIKQKCIDYNISVYSFLLSIFNILLSKWSSQEDLIVGTITTGREREEFTSIIGMFVNTLPLRSAPKRDKRFYEYAKEVHLKNIQLIDNQLYSLDNIIEDFQIRWDENRNPLFDTMFIFQNIADTQLRLGGVSINQLKTDLGASKFDLTLSALERNHKFGFRLEYTSVLFKEETISRFIEQYCVLIDNVLLNDDQELGEIEYVPKLEKLKITEEFNNTAYDYPSNLTVIDAFEKIVAEFPQNTALITDDTKISYKEFSAKVDKMCAYLSAHGCRKGDVVGIVTERSIDMMVGMFGVLKSGGIYMPMTPNFPKARKEYMLHNSDARLVLYQKEFYSDISSHPGALQIDLYEQTETQGVAMNPLCIPEDLAYIIYTSGTTGNPKGVMIKHKSLLNILCWMDINTPLSHNDVLIQTTTIVFDVSVWELFWWSIRGASLYLPKTGTEKEPQKLIASIVKNKVTVIHFVPAMLHLFLQALRETDMGRLQSIHTFYSSGEALSYEDAEKFNLLFGKNGIKLVNLYGPTEATIYASWFDCRNIDDLQYIPIGKPIGNTQIYIVDKNLKPVPIGIQGELCIAGDGLAEGYINNRQLTEEKFVNCPFQPEGMMYKTGDLASWLPDGNIKYHGRMDSQVKIRGYRIELLEIEAHIKNYDKIQNCAVTTFGVESDKSLAAYYSSEQSVDEAEIREYLLSIVPSYMVPSVLIQVDRFPLTENGKVDKKALPAPQVESNDILEAPNGQIQETLAVIWSEVLGVAKEKICIKKRFYQLGGHSLKAIGAVNLINKQLKVTISLTDFLNNSTIQQLSNLIKRAETQSVNLVTKTGQKEYYVSSSAQRRLFYLQELYPESKVYNMPNIKKYEGEADVDRINKAVNELVKRHEILRTFLQSKNGEIIQKIQPELTVTVRNTFLEHDTIDEQIVRFLKPFNLKEAPLFRVEVVQVADLHYYILHDFHHSISDAISMAIYEEEFEGLMNRVALPDVALQYKDYTEWIAGQIEIGTTTNQKDFWVNQYSETVPVLKLPYDKPRPKEQSFKGGAYFFYIAENQLQNLMQNARDLDVSLFSVLFSSFNIFLSAMASQEDIVVGVPTAGRAHSDFDRTMGMFVNTLPMRTKVESSCCIGEFIKSVSDYTIKCFENQYYPFEKLIDQLSIERDNSRSPLFDVMFVLQNANGQAVHTASDAHNLKKGQRIKISKSETVSRYDLTLIAFERDGKLCFEFEYCSDLFDERTIAHFSEIYLRVLDAIVSDTQKQIAEINMLSEHETEKIFMVFNDTAEAGDDSENVLTLFQKQVLRIPNNVALCCGKDTVTYKELDELSNRIANGILSFGVRTDDIVAVQLAPSVELVAAVIGILKTGCAYIYIDTNLPDERQKYLLKDSNAQVVITGNGLSVGLCNPVSIDELLANGGSNKVDREASVTGKNLAYIIYTSGTSGRPKGVQIQHKALLNFLRSFNNIFDNGFCNNDSCLSITNFSFDVSVGEVFVSLTNGCRLVLHDGNDALNPKLLSALIIENQINFAYIPPSLLDSVCELLKQSGQDCSFFNKLLVGVEPITFDTLNRFYDFIPSIKIVNGYGPTETTICSTFYELDRNTLADGIVPIGKPILNTQIYILNKCLKPVPIGVQGEMFISGEGLSKGYINRDELNREKFVDCPFLAGQKMYKTGDLAFWSRDGNISFVGRSDKQVKVRGYRIELLEIESVLLEYEGIKQTLVCPLDNEQGVKILVAFIIADKNPKTIQLKKYLRKLLPDYYIPAKYIILESFPVTINGKVDVKKLDEIYRSRTSDSLNQFIAPVSDTQKEIAQIWSDVLKVKNVGLNDTFFDLGGHSLAIFQVNSVIEERYAVKVPIKNYLTDSLQKISEIVELSKNE